MSPSTDAKAEAGRALAAAVESAELAVRMLQRCASALDRLEGDRAGALQLRALSVAQVADSIRADASAALSRGEYELTEEARNAFERRTGVRHG